MWFTGEVTTALVVQRPDAADQSAQAPALSNTGPVERAIHRYASGTAQLYDRRADEVTLDEVERIII